MAVHVEAEAAAPVDVVDVDEFAPVGLGFRDGRKLAGLGAEGLVLGKPESSEQEKAEGKRFRPGKLTELDHARSITRLLSLNWSASTPIFWAMRSRRLLMWASALAGRLQRR